MTDDNMESATRAERLLKVCREQCRVRRCKGAGTSCARVLLILVNLTFLVTGVILVVLGVWIHIYRDTLFFTYLLRFNNTSSPSSAAAAAAAAAHHQQHSISSSLSSIHSSSSPSATVASLQSSVGDIVSIDNCPFILIAAGCCITTVGFLGCCGAYAESVCFLGFFSILTVLFVAIEITIIAISPRAKRDLSIRLLESLQHQVHYNYNSTAQRVNDTQSDTYKLTLAWNTLQAYLNCCGAVGPQDYALSAWFNHTRDFTGVFVPSTCCKLNEPRDPRRPQVTEENICQVEAIVHLETTQPITQLHTQGCHEALMTWIDSHEHFVVSLLCNVVLLQIVNVVFACLLINWIRKKHTDYSWCDIEDYQ